MTLAVCYHARIQLREEFEIAICAKFHKFAPLMDVIDQAMFQRQISRFMAILYLIICTDTCTDTFTDTHTHGYAWIRTHAHTQGSGCKAIRNK